MTVQATFVDLSPGAGVQKETVSLALSRAMRWGGQAPPPTARYDSAGAVGGDDLLDRYSRHVDGLAIGELAESGRAIHPKVLDEARRCDALSGAAGGFPRDFEFVRSQIFEEKRQPLNGFSLFPTDSSVPLGARTHTVRRSLGQGEAAIHRGGSEFPRARTTYAEEQFGVVYVVCAVDVQFFDALTTDWAGLQQFQRDLRLAHRLVEERLNRIIWTGDTGSQVYGILNYPHLAKQVLPTAINDASVPEDIAQQIMDLIHTPMIQSGGTFSPTALAVSPQQHAYLFSRKHSTSGGQDTTIGEYILRNQAASGGGITSIVAAQELAGIGPSGEDGILAYRPDLDSLGHAMIQAPTTMPVYQSSPLETTTLVFAATGGVVMPDVGNHILGYASN